MKKKPTLKINLSQTAEYLGVTRIKAERLLAKGYIKGTYIEGNYRGHWEIDFNSVTDYMEK